MKPDAHQQQPVAIAATRGANRRAHVLLSGSLLLLLALLLLLP